MIITAHTAVGSLIALSVDLGFKKAGRAGCFLMYLLVFLLAFGSHFLLDAIPHIEYSYRGITTKTLLLRAVADSLAAGFLIFMTSRSLSTDFWGWWDRKILYLGAFASIIPDMIVFWSRKISPDWASSIAIKFTKFHNYFHASAEATFRAGVINQLIVVLVSGLLIFILSKYRWTEMES